MSDVDAIRSMASEHDLEFVDLDTYGVDPAAGEILPAQVARRHHVVAVKRKFGTPVIATSDPDDLYAQDSVRASIGRDFISVVAVPEQIGHRLDRLFGAETEDGAPDDGRDDSLPTPTSEQADAGIAGPVVESLWPEVSTDDAPLFSSPDESGGNEYAEEAPAVDRSANGSAYAEEATVADESVNGNGYAEEGPAADEPGGNGYAEEAPAADRSASGHGRRGKKADRKARAETSPDEAVESPDARDWQDFAVIPQFDDAVDGLVDVDNGLAEGDDAGHEGEAGASDGPFGALVPFAEPTDDGPAVGTSGPLEQVAPLEVLSDAVASLEPTTSELPGAEPDVIGDDAHVGDGRDFTADELVELALSVHGGDVQPSDVQPSTDSTTLAADLVAEAVATYQEQHSDEQNDDVAGEEGATATAPFPPLAKSLVDGDRVSLEEMETVLEEHRESGQSVARILTARKLVTEADLMWGMAQEMGLDFVDLDTVGIDFAEAGTIPEATARYHNVVVIGNENGTPVVAASNPTDVFAMDDLRTIIGRPFVVVVATRTQISAYIGRVFNSGGDAADMAMEASLGFDGTNQEPGVDDIQAVTEEAPIVRYVNLLILQALNERASDIHVEPTDTDLRIRYRIDGVLHDVSAAPRSISAAVTTRLKVMADLNVAEHRIPQDGRISLNVGSKGIDLRMATLPTIHGEKVVMRVLDKSSVVLGFADLGFDEDLLKTYEGIYTKPYGTILVTGPTGSGKSTTLYTTLTALNTPAKNIITVEDPVELQLKGVNQVQLNVKAGLTFASALRSILRSDPDIVLVGEIRDKETAVIAIEAALTGHMVLATLHTNSAAATPMRLIEMGLEPFLVTSSLSGVLAQRLARRLCLHCKEAYEPTEVDIAAAGWSLAEVEAVGGMSKVYRAVGCSACANTGYRGRKALAELMPMTEEIERSIIEGGSVDDIHRLAVTQGMMTLRQSGLRKAIEGETTLEEVLRVVA
jgi:type IV pilus assembly protein PilB